MARCSLLALVAVLALRAPASAQPYAWVPLQEFRGLASPPANVLRIVNLGTTHVRSIDLPSGVVLGLGALDAATGHYFLITNLGTGEFETDPPRLLPRVKPWSGSALFLSPDGRFAYVCGQAQPQRTCALVRRSDDAIIASRTGVLGVAFDQAGGHVLTTESADARTIEYSAAATPDVVIWRRAYTVPALQRPLVAVSGNRVFTASPVLGAPALEVIDVATGAVMRSAVIQALPTMIAAGGGRLVVVGQADSLLRRPITTYSGDTLEVQAETSIGDLVSLTSVVGVDVTSDGQTIVLRTTGRGSAAPYLRLLDASTLQIVPGGGFPGNGGPSGISLTTEPLCRVHVAPTLVELPAIGGVATFAIIADPGCGIWSASQGGEGLQLVGEPERIGSGTVTYQVAQNLAATYELTQFPRIAADLGLTISVARIASPPDAPRVAAVKVAEGRVQLDWVPATAGPIPTGFVIEGGRAGAGVSTRITAPKTARSISALVPSAGDFFVQVRSRNNAGEGAASPAVRFSVAADTAPAPPVNLQADVQASVVRLSWDASDSGSPPERFVVEARAGQSGNAFVQVASTVAGETKFAAVVPARLSGDYTIRIRAANAAGVGGPSNEVVVTPSTCVTPPQSPAALDAVVTGAVVELKWSAAAGGAEQYAVEVGSRVNEADLGTFPTSGPVLSWRAQAPVNSYFVRVRGRNACGLGPPSPERVVFVLYESPYGPDRSR